MLPGNCSCQTTKIFHFPKKRKLGTLIGLRPEHDNIQIKQNNKQNVMKKIHKRYNNNNMLYIEFFLMTNLKKENKILDISLDRY